MPASILSDCVRRCAMMRACMPACKSQLHVSVSDNTPEHMHAHARTVASGRRWPRSVAIMFDQLLLRGWQIEQFVQSVGNKGPAEYSRAGWYTIPIDLISSDHSGVGGALSLSAYAWQPNGPEVPQSVKQAFHTVNTAATPRWQGLRTQSL